jgi:8-oxo-dGTP pyrophosphatase MutT (NUDIX family)
VKGQDRRASRLVVLDESGHVLLFQYKHPTGGLFWATPGGGLEDGETFEQAAAREAVEELGAESPELQALWQGVAAFSSGARQQERFFLLEGRGINLDISAGGRQEEGVLQVRWWSRSDIETTSEQLFPEGFAARLRERLES